MNGTRVMLQGAINGGFRPPKEAREIEAALEAAELNAAMLGLAESLLEDLAEDEDAKWLRWFKMQGDA